MGKDRERGKKRNWESETWRERGAREREERG